MAQPPFDDSRRLTGSNLFFDGPGAVLEATPLAPDVIADWRARVARMRAVLGWLDAPSIARTHAHGVSLALASPLDQLFTATEVNEWALWSALHAHAIAIAEWPHAPGFPAAWDESAATATLAACACAERNPALRQLADEATRRELNMLVDDDTLTLGSGRGARSWPAAALPQPATIDWNAIADVPIVLVTGSNGKTTTTRLLAALARAHGWRAVHTCTDGVYVDGEAIASGDYSGPAGARLALRQPDIDAAVLETARGGILRRGIAPSRADVAIVTNISDDHFGEYGIDDLDGLADVKLAVGRPLGTRGTLVLNGDDALLLRHAAAHAARTALFALDADAPALIGLRARGGATCGVRAGRLVLEQAGATHDLGGADALPLTFGGAARYNLGNLAAAALAAHALGIGADTLRLVLASFGATPGDNPGRLEHYSPGGIEVLVDYAHNPDGMHALLAAAARVRRARVGLLLGQAGNRTDAAIRALADVVAKERPDRIVLKDLPGYLRGRADGDVPAILRAELLGRGVAAACIAVELDEWNAVLGLLRWARPGDTLVLPVHGKQNRPRVSALLAQLAHSDWRAGNALPAGTG
ncbi:MAG: Mur ligase [Proteobacteria bacterium]|nr:Mur ligase [Pseudomonadota bacterium]